MLFYQIFILLVLLTLANVAHGIHLTGTFKTNEFFKFLARFGMQSTDSHNKVNTRGYIYGNLTLLSSENLHPADPSTNELPSNALVMLTLLDYNYFIDYYNRRLLFPKTTACSMMFEKIKKNAYFYECDEKNTLDFIRRVPCARNKLCIDEENAVNVINNYQFTFKTEDVNQARFWYISLVACIRDTKTCEWRDLSDYYQIADLGVKRGGNEGLIVSNLSNLTTQAMTTANKYKENPPVYTFAYDIWVVNGNPSAKSNNRFEHQFSYELHDVFEIYLSSFMIYLFILPFIIFRLYLHFHYLYLQLLVYVSVELTCRFLSIVHNLVYSYDGHGVRFLQFVSDFLEALASSILILILISIAKGWTIRSKRLKTTRKFYALGIFLQLTLVISHMVSLATIDTVFNTNSYETHAGYVELGIRFVCMVWFLFELKETFDNLELIAFKNVGANGDVVGIPINENEENDDIPSNNKNTNSIHDLSFNDQDDNEYDYEIERNGKKYNRLLNNNRQNNNNSKIIDNLTKEERFKRYQKFYLHYGACCLVWFIYLPILIFITSFVSELYRLRLVLSIRYFVNFISVVILFYIMWSPKTPLKLPGKKLPTKYELINLQYLLDTESNEAADGDEDVLYVNEGHTNSDK